MNGGPHIHPSPGTYAQPQMPLKPRRLVLCFDGTSNKYNGNQKDTNIVKIYQMLNRDTNDQFHYYQRT